MAENGDNADNTDNAENAENIENAEDNDAPEDVLPEKPRRRTGLAAGIGIAIVAVAVVVVLILVNTLGDSGDSADSAGKTTVRIGVVDASAEYWKPFTTVAAEQGIDVQLTNFSDYNQVNPALSQGQLDLNLFQHLLFLGNYNASRNDSLTPIGSTYVVPLSLYSNKHSNLANIPSGGKIAIPNDPTNQARALLVLQSAGLISLKGGGNPLSTPADINSAASKVTVTPVDAAQTVAALSSVDGSVVNNNFALDAKLDPTKALFNDDPTSASAEPYINVIVAREQDKDNPTFHKIVQIYKDQRVASEVQRESNGTTVFVDRPPAELVGVLDRLEQTVRNSG